MSINSSLFDMGYSKTTAMVYFAYILAALAVTAVLFAPLKRSNKKQAGLLAALMLTGSAGLWLVLGGKTDLGAAAQNKVPARQASAASDAANRGAIDREQNHEDLIAQLRARLTELASVDPEGWALLARSEMRLGKYDQAMQAYDKAAELSGNDPAIIEQRAAAKDYIARQSAASQNTPGPSAADIEAAAQMSPEQRQAMIQQMVDNLAHKLSENPDDPQGWARLLRARGILGQEAQLQTDIAAMKAAYAERPEIAEQILSVSGFSD